MNRRIKTENGWVRGLPAADPRITSFKGIPFAAPPVGDNRWRAPQPCSSWQGDRLAFEYGPIAMQDKGKPGRDNFWSREWAVDFDLPMSEDCLYLNIWAPADGYPVGVGDQYREREDMPVPPSGHLPVYVWFFGGGLQVGNTAEMEFDGERIARRGVVVVTVSYRLNVFGFLAHPDLTREAPDAPTNFGFLDQQYATQWVKRNIAAFGGDPENITIGGQSSGGMSVCAQLANPDNRGLFQKAIIESGIFIPPFSNGAAFKTDLRQGEENGVKFLSMLGAATIEEARKIDADVVLDKAVHSGLSPHMWSSVIDNVFCKVPTNEWFLQPGHVECPLFMSSTDIEMNIAPSANNRDELRALAERLNGVDVERFMAAFEGANDAESIHKKGQIAAIDLAIHAINRITENRQPIWMCRFSAEIPGWDHPGAFHSSDIWFYFENLAKCWRTFTGKHYDLARQMCDSWANFMWNGDPNGMGTDGKPLPTWPRLTTEHPVRMEFADTATPGDATPSPLMDVLLDAYVNTH
jgi:para-nitrobenzyl esterase